MEFNDRTMQMIRYAIIFGGPIVGEQLGKHYATTDVANFADWVILGLPYAASIAAAVWGYFVKKGTVAVPVDVVKTSEENPAIPTIPTVSGATGQISIATPQPVGGPI